MQARSQNILTNIKDFRFILPTDGNNVKIGLMFLYTSVFRLNDKMAFGKISLLLLLLYYMTQMLNKSNKQYIIFFSIEGVFFLVNNFYIFPSMYQQR